MTPERLLPIPGRRFLSRDPADRRGEAYDDRRDGESAEDEETVVWLWAIPAAAAKIGAEAKPESLACTRWLAHPRRANRIRLRECCGMTPEEGRCCWPESGLPLIWAEGERERVLERECASLRVKRLRRRPRRASPVALLLSRREHDPRTARGPRPFPRTAGRRGRASARPVPDPRVRTPPQDRRSRTMNPSTSPISRAAMRPSRSRARARWTSPSIKRREAEIRRTPGEEVLILRSRPIARLSSKSSSARSYSPR